MADDNRAEMLALAVAAIDEGGEESIRVNDLVAAAGLKPPALYHHFGNRDGLVIAAQVERYRHQLLSDIGYFESSVASCRTAEEFERAVIAMWRMVLSERGPSRWVRVNALGSAFTREKLEIAISAANDELVAEMVRVLEPFAARGWIRTDIDLATALAWQHSMLLSRATVERHERLVDLAEWDRCTIEALVHRFFVLDEEPLA